LKYGVGATPDNLVWMVGGVEKWDTLFTADTWFNFAYDIDVRLVIHHLSYLTCDLILQFSSSTVGLWASIDSNPLTKVVQNIAASTFTNSADWHLGVLRIVTNQTPEDWYFSGVYVESGPVTTSIGSGSGGGSGTSTSTSTANPTTSSTSTSTGGPMQTQWGQCGGAQLEYCLNF